MSPPPGPPQPRRRRLSPGAGSSAEPRTGKLNKVLIAVRVKLSGGKQSMRRVNWANRSRSAPVHRDTRWSCPPRPQLAEPGGAGDPARRGCRKEPDFTWITLCSIAVLHSLRQAPLRLHRRDSPTHKQTHHRGRGGRCLRNKKIKPSPPAAAAGSVLSSSSSSSSSSSPSSSSSSSSSSVNSAKDQSLKLHVKLWESAARASVATVTYFRLTEPQGGS